MSKFSLGQVLVPVSQLDNDFRFVVGKENYPCSLIAASIYCNTIRLLVLNDPTVRYIVYPEEDPKSLFSLFIQLLNGQRVRLSDANVGFLYAVANYFQCDDLLKSTGAYLQNGLTPEKCFAYIRKAKSPTRCPAEIQFLASHLPSLLDRPEFAELPLSVLDALLSSPAVNEAELEERDLVRFVSGIVDQKKTPESFALFAHILFEELECEEMKQFLKMVPATDIGGALWAAISQRLAQPVTPPLDDTEEF